MKPRPSCRAGNPLAGVYGQSIPAGLEWETEGSGVVITNYTGTAAAAAIPEKINALPVVRIGEYAFAYCGTLKMIAIPGSVARIGLRRFVTASG